MTEPEIQRADEILRRHGVRYVVVGGQAIGKSVSTTDDVDVMVTTTDYAETVPLLRDEPALKFEWEERGVTRFRILAVGVPLDILDAATFAGNRTGEEFFAFLLEEESTERDGIRFASPAAVWYTRLLVRRWKTYAEKILRNAIGGVGAGRLHRVEQIAERFGTKETVRERVEYVRAEMKRPDLEYILQDN
ncbi:MAG: hypothetical protein ACLPP2_06485 [Thermoplasmata archaeon]